MDERFESPELDTADTTKMHDAELPISWSTSPRYRGICEDVEQRLRDWSNEGETSRPDLIIVKQGRHRRVLKITLPTMCVYLKQQPDQSPSRRLQSLVRRTSCEREFVAYQQLRSVGISTPEPLGWGIQQSDHGNISYLLTVEFPHAVPLDVLKVDPSNSFSIAAQNDPILRRELISQLARLTARLHHSNLSHEDYHAGNILASWTPESSPNCQLALIDLAGIKRRASVSVDIRLRDIAMLFHTFTPRAQPADAVRFFRLYLESLESLDDQVLSQISQRKLLHQAMHILLRHLDIANAKADRKWARGNRRVEIYRDGLYQARGLTDLKSSGLLTILDEPDSLLENIPDADFRKRNPERTVARTYWPIHTGDYPRNPIYVKRLTGSLFRHRGCWLLGIYSRFRRAWGFGRAMRRRGAATPRPLLFVERAIQQGQTTIVEETLVTEEALGMIPLSPFVRYRLSHYNSLERQRWIRCYAKVLGAALAKLHHARFDHRDLKGTNILISESTTRPDYVILDLDAVRRWLILPSFQRHKNLARLLASLQGMTKINSSDALRFLRTYRRTAYQLSHATALGAVQDRSWKSAWKSISRLAEAYHQRKKSSNQVVAAQLPHELPPQESSQRKAA